MEQTKANEQPAVSEKIKEEKCKINELRDIVSLFDPGETGATWSPQSGTDLVGTLNKLAKQLEEKAMEIKNYVRKITVEELNELDGFDRCSTAQKTDMDAQRPAT